MKSFLILALLVSASCLTNAQTAYIANANGNTLSVVNLETNTVVKNIEVGQYYFATGITRDEKTLYLGGSDGLKIIDIETNTVKQTLNITGIKGLCVSPDGSKVFIACGYSGLLVLTTATMSYFESITVGANPQGVACIGNKTVFVANNNEDSISVIDAPTSFVKSTIKFPYLFSPVGLCMNSDGTKLYVATNNFVHVIKTSDYSKIASIQYGATINYSSGLSGISISPDDSKAYVTSRSFNTVGVIDTASNTLLKTIPVDGWPISIAVSPDGKKVVTTCSTGNSINIIATDTNTVTAKMTGFNNPCSMGNFIISKSTPLKNNTFEIQQKFTVFPNPATDIININIPNLISGKGYKANIYNTIGQLIKSFDLNDENNQFNTKNWGSTGVYYIHILDDAQNILETKKIILH